MVWSLSAQRHYIFFSQGIDLKFVSIIEIVVLKFILDAV